MCVGAFQLAAHPDLFPPPRQERAAWWLAERQTATGGLNGRPEKLPDVCYSWWCLSTLTMLRRPHWIDQGRLSAFIIRCQDVQRGGISDREDDAVDVYHTFFGLAGLSLMVFPGLGGVDALHALPTETVARMGLPEL